MNGVAFTFAILFGLDAVEVEEAVMRACVERTVPRRLWREDVQAEIKRQKADNPDCRLTDYLCGHYYEKRVNEKLREHFLEGWFGDPDYAWPFEEQLWLATQGQQGEAPQPWKLNNLNCKVLRIGRALPAAVRDGVPVVRWREKIGRPK